MATQYPRIKGKIMYGMFYEPDEYEGARRWKMMFFPEDGGEWQKIQKAGIQAQPKKLQETGEEYINLRRDCSKVINNNLVVFSPPIIYMGNDKEPAVSYVDENGDLVRSFTRGQDEPTITRKGEPILAGNGSTVEVTLAVYDTRRGKGTRVESIRILDLVEYNPEGETSYKGDTDDEENPFEKE